MRRRSRSALYSDFRWFVVMVQGSYEKKAALILETMGKAGKIPDYDLVRRIWIPQNTVQLFTPTGALETRSVTTLPGYLLIEAILTGSLYAALCRPDLPHIFGWLQQEDSWPSEIAIGEIQTLAILQNFMPEKPEFIFRSGDKVSVPSLGVRGTVLGVSESGMMVEVDIFGRQVSIRIPKELFSEMTVLS